MADFDYNKNHARAFYAPKTVGNVKKGQLRWCHAKDQEVLAKRDGFTSEKYVPSDWPKSFFHRKTGECKAVGNLAWSDEQNAAAVKSLGDEWTDQHVAVPEPVAPIVAGAAPAFDMNALLAIVGDQQLLVKRLDELEQVIIQQEETRVLLATRIAELEAAINEPEDLKPKKPAAAPNPRERASS